MEQDLAQYLSTKQYHSQTLLDLANYDVKWKHLHRDLYGDYEAHVAVVYRYYVQLRIGA